MWEWPKNKTYYKFIRYITREQQFRIAKVVIFASLLWPRKLQAQRPFPNDNLKECEAVATAILRYNREANEWQVRSLRIMSESVSWQDQKQINQGHRIWCADSWGRYKCQKLQQISYRAWEQRYTPVTGSQPLALIIPFESDSLGLDEKKRYDSRGETGGPCATQKTR